MAYLSPEEGSLIVRVVYDGPPEAGKTTTVHAISKAISPYRRGEYHKIEAPGERTEYFDWLDFGGGYVRDYRLRCQILSVPGQRTLFQRRRELLRSADTVIFVADSQVSATRANVESYRQLAEILEDRHREEEQVGLIVQANKQDSPAALKPQTLAATLGLAPTIPVLGSQAVTGGSVMNVFVVAIRLAVERAIRQLEGSGVIEQPEEMHSVDAQLDALRKLEVRPDAMEHGRAVSVSVPGPAPQFAPPRDQESGGDRDSASTAAAAQGELRIPAAGEVPAGCLWPPMTGRSILAAVNGASQISVHERVADWAPNGSIELQAENGWVLHTCPDWSFDGLDAGRFALMHLVRASLALGELIPDGRTYIAASDGDQWRIWMITPDLPTVADIVSRALRTAEPEAIEEALRRCEAVLQGLPKRGEGPTADAPLNKLAIQKGKPVWLPPPEKPLSCADSDGVLGALGSLLRTHERFESELRPKLADALRTAAIGDRLREVVHSVAAGPSHANDIAAEAHDQSE